MRSILQTVGHYGTWNTLEEVTLDLVRIDFCAVMIEIGVPNGRDRDPGGHD